MDRSGFSCEKDRLICLGDVADRRRGVKHCVEELLKVKDLVYVLGNHDLWAMKWMNEMDSPGIWRQQGGEVTMESYRDGVPDSHLDFFRRAVYYHIESNRLFVHGGINESLPLEKQDPDDFLWDRTLVFNAIEQRGSNRKFTSFDEVFVGHTPTLNFTQEERGNIPSDHPIRACNIWLLDTGAGWSGGRLTMMDVETKEFWQSDRLE
jgi:serine/threonine protein phosphatase 1